ncbi:MAG TPA: thioesterase family protein [Candidatus Baltobacteraceae bacterium]|jgi:YbgC/YbaW family acyl-CoA thioester hydrolase|nr:thioesterase family protein [Candidatus Baltobacteraceae bacterium]
MTARIFEVRERVRWSDCDPARIIFYGAYVRLLQVAETELYRDLGFLMTTFFDKLDFGLPRRHLEFDFERPALLDDELLMRSHIANVGTSSFTLKTEFVRSEDSQLLATSSLVLVSIDRATMRSKPLPEIFANALRAAAEGKKSCAPDS